MNSDPNSIDQSYFHHSGAVGGIVDDAVVEGGEDSVIDIVHEGGRGVS